MSEKEIELEIVKNLRKNWIPPEEDIEAGSYSKTKMEPGKLQIKNVYCNNKKNEPDQARIERQIELEEVRKTFAEKRESKEFNEVKVVNSCQSSFDRRPRSKSEYRSNMKDDFWKKLDLQEDHEDRGKETMNKELERIKMIRQKDSQMIEDNNVVLENKQALSTKHELGQLRSYRASNDSVGMNKVKEDLNIINAPTDTKTSTNKMSTNPPVHENILFDNIDATKESKVTEVKDEASMKPEARGRKRVLKKTEEKQSASARSKSLTNLKNVSSSPPPKKNGIFP